MRFATVTALTPLRVRVDGHDDDVAAISGVGTGRLTVGARVMVYPTGTQLVAIGPLTTNG